MCRFANAPTIAPDSSFFRWDSSLRHRSALKITFHSTNNSHQAQCYLQRLKIWTPYSVAVYLCTSNKQEQTGKKNLIELLERGNKHTLDADSRGRRVLNMLLFREWASTSANITVVWSPSIPKMLNPDTDSSAALAIPIELNYINDWGLFTWRVIL